MLYCPAGDGAFPEDTELCPECGRELMETAPVPIEGAEGDAMVWLVTAPNEPEAYLWADVLREAGIPVFVRAGGPGVGAWASASSFEHELLVHLRNLLPARATVRDLLSGDRGVSVRARRKPPVVNARQR